MSTKTRFEKEAKGNSEMAYWCVKPLVLQGLILIDFKYSRTEGSEARALIHPRGNSTWEVTKSRFLKRGCSCNYILFYIVDKLKFTEK